MHKNKSLAVNIFTPTSTMLDHNLLLAHKKANPLNTDSNTSNNKNAPANINGNLKNIIINIFRGKKFILKNCCNYINEEKLVFDICSKSHLQDLK